MNVDQRIQTVQSLIEDIKSDSNSLERNKSVSHAEDLLAWLIRWRAKVPASLAAMEPTGIPGVEAACICPPGAVDETCIVHGKQPTNLNEIKF